ncbi:MAG: CHASE2 domain-containing protein [Ignavibacteriae bacterium]|nr:CHASE2 domain-containing protein [Ignavibacteriota bacterium]
MAAEKKRLTSLLTKLGVGLGIGLLVALLTQGWLFELPIIDDVEHLTTDYRFQTRYNNATQGNPDQFKADFRQKSSVIIVGIDQPDVEAMPDKFPFPRNYYAHLIENLNRAGARVIAFDLTFTSDSPGDSVLREVLQKYDNVILGVNKPEEGTGGLYSVRSLDENYGNVFFTDNRQQVGIVNVLKDPDDKVRAYTPMYLVGEGLTPTFALATVGRYYNAQPLETASIEGRNFRLKDRAIPRFTPTSFMVNYYGPVETFHYVPFQQVIDDESFQTNDEIEIEESIDLFDEGTMSLFKDKIVLIGSKMPEERDFHATPMINPDGQNIMHGVEIHATAIQNIIEGNHIAPADSDVELGLIFLLSLLSFTGLLQLKHLKIKFIWLIELVAVILMLGLVFGIFQFAVLAFSNGNSYINIVNPSLAVVFSYVGTIVYQYLSERQQKALVKSMFSHYISPAVVNELIANPEKAALGGDKRELTAFFSDIASFTTISESLSPEALVVMLNEYLNDMTDIIIKHSGTLDKYEGDAIMAFWGAPIPQKDHALRACLAALEMQKRLEQMRPTWKKKGKPQLHVRCGINTGTMIVGNMGGKDRFDYTIIGDSVNLASRLEGANKQYESKIMISEFTHKHVQGKVVVRELDLIQVKGKTEPIKVFELLGATDMQRTSEQKEADEMYSEGLTLYRQRKWDEAIAYMNQAYQLDPTCYVSQVYAQRATLYQLHPPPDDWNGVFVMTTK